MKNIIKEIICSVISICVGYNENITYVSPCKAINALSKMTFYAFWIALLDDIYYFEHLNMPNRILVVLIVSCYICVLNG